MVGFWKRLSFLFLILVCLAPGSIKAQANLQLDSLSAENVRLIADFSAHQKALSGRKLRLRLHAACDGAAFEVLASRSKAKLREVFDDSPYLSEICDYRAKLTARKRRKRTVVLNSNVLRVEVPPDPEFEYFLSLLEPVQPAANDPIVRDLPLAPGQRECDAVDSEQLFIRTNYHRYKIGLPLLAPQTILQQAARIQSIKIASLGELTHQGWFETLQELNYPGLYMSQNIASKVQSGSALADLWLTSEQHKRNLLNSRANTVGIACVLDRDGNKWWSSNYGS